MRAYTSPTQPYPRGDAFVPHEIDVAPEAFPLVNHGRIFTPFWADRGIAKPSARGGANWPPSSYDPATNYFFACGTDGMNLFTGGEENQATGIFAALDMKTNRRVAAEMEGSLLQRLGRHRRWSGVRWAK
jgi:hypothetical protein